MLHKAPDCDPEPKKLKKKNNKKNIACIKYVLSWFHENSLSHILLKDERKQHTKKSCDYF